MFENGQPGTIAQTGPTILAYFYTSEFFAKFLQKSLGTTCVLVLSPKKS